MAEGRKRTRNQQTGRDNHQGSRKARARFPKDNSDEESSSSHAATVVAARRMMGIANLAINDSEVNSKAPVFLPDKTPKVTPSGANSSSQIRNPNFYIERACDLIVAMSLYSEPAKTKICELAHSAMDELSKVAMAEKPLWQPLKGQKFETMDNTEYLKSFAQFYETVKEIERLAEVGDTQELPSYDSLKGEDAPRIPDPPPKQFANVEASRDVRYVKMKTYEIIQLLMNVIVTRGVFLGVFMSGEEGSYNGRLQMMTAEFQLPTPFVGSRECYFGRYCKKLSNGVWGVVDFSLEKIFPCPENKFRRRPSGCLIKAVPNGYSKVVGFLSVIWVEHAVDNNRYSEQFKPIVSSGLGFGASRWLASLIRSIDCSETLKSMTTSIHGETCLKNLLETVSGGQVFTTQSGKVSLVNLAGRIMRAFCSDVNASSRNRWAQVSSLIDFREVRIKVKNIVKDLGKPKGATVLFSSSTWLPIPPKSLYDFLRDPKSRIKWDLLSSKTNNVEELAYVIQGNDPRNRVSILHLNDESEKKLGMLYVQESYIDSTGSSYIVYSPIDNLALSSLFSGENPLEVPIEPSGFTIFPDGKSLKGEGNGNINGSILTISFCIMLSTTHTMPLIVPAKAVAKFNELSAHTINAIKNAFLRRNAMCDG
ncbi:hypothetical protein VNO77_37114 [Canavalia gladiata]|uniref:START domain-containing protein n=1 Tax=Canavalia gladiata TaxID=3824 RepID=A0AAN9PY73_CANGL